MSFSFAKSYNKGKKFDVDTTGFKYVPMIDFFDEKKEEQRVYTVRGFYINTKGNYGDAPVMATDTCFIDLPHFMLDTIKSVLENEEAIEAINNGLVGFQVYSYEMPKYNRVCYSINFVDIKA